MVREPIREYNFDGLVGPSHNYAGLAPGNLASTRSAGNASNPRAAALQGLEKMRFVAGLGVGQALLPPQPRPDLSTLRRLGLSGGDAEVLGRAAAGDGQLLRLCSSASAMWTANAATVAPSPDTQDHRCHLSVANLSTMFHRCIEAPTTTTILRTIFSDEQHFAVHTPLPGALHFADEGAANHTRLETSDASLHLFGWGRRTWSEGETGDWHVMGQQEEPKRYPARQALEASLAVARANRLQPAAAIFCQQHPAGIDAGSFHSDVLCVGNQRFLMLHELAFDDPARLLEAIRRHLGEEFSYQMASDAELPIADAVASYPFNSQLLSLDDGSMCIVAPRESEDNAAARRFLEAVVGGENPVTAVHYRDVNASMNNGGGPACLRLRVSLTQAERARIQPRVFLNDALYTELRAFIERHYRDRLIAADLADPKFLEEVHTALDELTSILRLGSVYDFQT